MWQMGEWVVGQKPNIDHVNYNECMQVVDVVDMALLIMMYGN